MKSNRNYFKKNPKVLQGIADYILIIADIPLLRLYIDTFAIVVSEVVKKSGSKVNSAYIDDDYFEDKEFDLRPDKYSLWCTFLPFGEECEIHIWFRSNDTAHLWSEYREANDLLREIGCATFDSYPGRCEMEIASWDDARALLVLFQDLESSC